DDECIHGLDGGLCAVCFPQAAPEVVAAPVVRKRSSNAKPPSLTGPRTATPTVSAAAPRKAAAVAKRPIDNVGEQRIYHVTHISNLAAILASGGLLADASDALEARPAVDVSAADVREARRAAALPGENGLVIADYVPFFLSPNARVWDAIRARSGDARLVLNAHGSDAYDFVIFVSTVKKVVDAHAATNDDFPAAVAVADGDAAHASTRVVSTSEGVDRMLVRLRSDLDSDALLTAELLVQETFPLELVTLLGVANDRVRDAVREILKASTYRPKVAVYPPWFQASEEEVLED
ncbi:DarT ssDNA thymidine ADP-ribosyltransferase family protein, partial [Cryobacterium roopkundense]